MTSRNWMFTLIIAACAVGAAYGAQREAGAFGVVLSMFIVGGLTAIGIAVLAPEPAAETGIASPEESKLPTGFGRQLLDLIPTPLFLFDARGRVSYANAATRALLPRLEPGMHFSLLFRAPAFVQAVTEVIDGSAPRNVSFSAHLQGMEVQLAARVATLPTGGDFGPGRQVIVQLDDHTQRLATERMRSDFVANASHELRTPLASIIGYIETLRGHAKDDPDAQAHFLGIMDLQAARMQRLVDDLMSLSRIEMDAHTAPAELCDLDDLVQETADGMRPLLSRTAAKLDVDLAGLGAQVRADRHQIAQVVTNLIDNAVKYGGEGVHVAVSTAPPDVRFPGMTGITVTDDGPGIAREHIHRLTERFYRVNAKQSIERGGTGLGLAIVKHILARHGGELDISSQVGQGSRFTMWLPVAEYAESDLRADEEVRLTSMT
ncbi:sensor histidine kinase [Pontivivens ytuae]|uniref:histidine kinase n=1 Tax=Pontivivens ytuae TaxID=2789856 RepID=A0A7S9LUP0_9RHOB|nr:ATP-binding protein [Pontivivens ytuae]QPH55330.1 hypothetical protein I0K15_06210 [Pontivivens ytuae]